jgi:hypothetical protein
MEDAEAGEAVGVGARGFVHFDIVAVLASSGRSTLDTTLSHLVVLTDRRSTTISTASLLAIVLTDSRTFTFLTRVAEDVVFAYFASTTFCAVFLDATVLTATSYLDT